METLTSPVNAAVGLVIAVLGPDLHCGWPCLQSASLPPRGKETPGRPRPRHGRPALSASAWARAIASLRCRFIFQLPPMIGLHAPRGDPSGIAGVRGCDCESALRIGDYTELRREGAEGGQKWSSGRVAEGLRVVGCRVSGVGCRVSGVGCRVSGVGALAAARRAGLRAMHRPSPDSAASTPLIPPFADSGRALTIERDDHFYRASTTKNHPPPSPPLVSPLTMQHL